jgi:hypothetical protein
MRLLDLEIHAWLRHYLRGAATLDDFEDWFAPATWHVERSGNVQAIELADEIRLALVDVSAGEMTEDEFRALAASLDTQRTDRIRFFQTAIRRQLGVGPSERPLNRTLTLAATVPATE